MALAVADLEKVKRREPDFERLERMVEEGARRKGLEGSPYRRIGQATGYSVALIHNIVVKHSRPQREVLIALADYFDDPREEWLVAGGFDVESLPQDRGFTTAERTVARWLKGLSDEDRTALLRRAAEEQRRQGGDT